MPASQEHITSATPMGANIVLGGATFRVFAPSARAIYINGIFDGVDFFRKHADYSLLLVKKNNYWRGFVPILKDGHNFFFFVVATGLKDSNRAPSPGDWSPRGTSPGPLLFQICIWVGRAPHRSPWHDRVFRPP